MLTLIILAVVIITIVVGLSILLNKLAKNANRNYSTVANQDEDTEVVNTFMTQNNSNNQRGNVRNRAPDSSNETIATISTTEIDRMKLKTSKHFYKFFN